MPGCGGVRWDWGGDTLCREKGRGAGPEEAHSSMWQSEQGTGFTEKMKEDTPEQGQGLVSLW